MSDYQYKPYTVWQFNADLAAGAYVWPGGYPRSFICADSGCLCFRCAKENAGRIRDEVIAKSGDGFEVAGCNVEWETEELSHCEHCNELIEVAYPTDEQQLELDAQWDKRQLAEAAKAVNFLLAEGKAFFDSTIHVARQFGLDARTLQASMGQP